MARIRRRWRDTLRACFHPRNVIIVSDKSVENYALSGKAQLAVIGTLVATFCGASFFAGNYVSSQSALELKEMQIATSRLQNQQIGQEYTLLKQDLQRLAEGDALSDYDRIVIEQHISKPELDGTGTIDLQENESSDLGQRLLERLAYLEGQVVSLRQEKQQIVQMVEQRATNRIKELEQIISMTGLQRDALRRQAELELARRNGTKPTDAGKGGPFIPQGYTSQAMDMQARLDEWVLLDHIVSKLPLGSPMRSARITSHFGHRSDPFTHRAAVHEGIDFSGGRNADVLAAAKGVVTFAGRQGAYGNMIEISHGMGVTTRYGHLNSITVRRGQQVTEGMLIGRQGSTGRSTGSHLHYEVRLNDRAVNPIRFLKAGSHAQKQKS